MTLDLDGFRAGTLFRMLPRAIGPETRSLVVCYWVSTGILNVAIFILLAAGDGASLLAGFTAGVFMIAIFVAATLVHYAAIHAAYARLCGAPVPPIEALRAAFARVWACIGLSLVLTVIVSVGSMLLVIPGLFACVVFALALPSLVVRGTGVFDSLGISWSMTKGYRLRILGCWVLFFLAGLLAFLIALLAIGIVLLLTGLAGSPMQELFSRLAEVILNGLYLPAAAVFAATMFRMIEVDRECRAP